MIGLSVVLAVAVGMAIATQTQFSGVLGQRLGIMESVFIIHLGGFLVSGLYLAFAGGGNLAAWRSAPLYVVLSAGLLGVLIVGGYSFIIPRIGLAPAITLAVSAQLIFSATLSHFGALGAIQQPITVSRIIGILVLLVGTGLFLR